MVGGTETRLRSQPGGGWATDLLTGLTPMCMVARRRPAQAHVKGITGRGREYKEGITREGVSFEREG